MNEHTIFVDIDNTEHSLDITRAINEQSHLKTVSITDLYHKSEIDQNALIIKHAIRMIWVGIILVAAGLFFSAFTNVSLLSTLPGAFIDIFSGAMIYMVDKSSASKQKYFESLSYAEQEKRIIDLIHSIDDPNSKKNMVAAIIDTHYNK